MNNQTTHKTGRGDCCTDKCESGLRNNYFQGKRLTPDSFRVEQNYLLQRRRMLNRGIYGWGVVYGYAIKDGPPDKSNGPGRLSIGPGLALDTCGRELLHTGTYVDMAELIDDKGNPFDPDKPRSAADTYRRHDQQHVPQRWLLSVHYAEQKTGLVKVKDSCECEWDEWDHTCETVVFSLRPVLGDECCDDFGCELTCECSTGECCDEARDEDDKDQDQHQRVDDYRQNVDAEEPRRKDTLLKRGGCRCLCEYVTKLQFVDCAPLCTEIEGPCGTIWVDLKNSVPLACVDLSKDDCDRWTFSRVEACGPRRLVKRNDMLFDLIRGCDLTRITDFGWKSWHRLETPIPFKDFWKALGPDGDEEDEYITEAFWVRFSRPVRKDTLRPDCFAMTILHPEDEGGWWQSSRVPIVRVDTEDFWEPGDPPGHVRGGRIVVDGAWVEDGVRGRRSIFNDDKTWVEIEIRGDFIVDCNGQTVDANPRGLTPPVPTGNGVPGDSFLSTFQIESGRDTRDRDRQYDRATS
jgi:hypothetical protein